MHQCSEVPFVAKQTKSTASCGFLLVALILIVLAAANANASTISAPDAPTEDRGTWVFYAGKMPIKKNTFLDPHGVDFAWSYARKNPLPDQPRIVVGMHGATGGRGAVELFAPSEAGDIEVRTQDADTYNQNWREWWMFGADGKPYPGRRIAAMLDYVVDRYDLDLSRRGIVLEGGSMGGAGAVVQTMILPDPWRELIAYSTGRVGPMLPRAVYRKSPGRYITMAPDKGKYKAVWDEVDFSIQAHHDPVVRGMHYRHRFSSDDMFSEGNQGNTQLEFVNLVEKHVIGGAFVWTKADHGTHEPGVRLPEIMRFERPEQDVSLDRAHPAITNSTGNYPQHPSDRVDEKRFPRGHYNMGISWDHSAIIDSSEEIVFPLRYSRRQGMGKDIPDQPQEITVSVTPRRPRHFELHDGDVLSWSFDGGKLAGKATVIGDTITIDDIPLKSGAPYKTLRIYRDNKIDASQVTSPDKK